MSESDDPYHCDDCGFCRLGGRSKFKHCHDCGMCIDITEIEDHGCKSQKYMSNCPICQEDLFSSRSPIHEMPCGHAIHWHCFQNLIKYDSRCPVCKKTVDSHEHMAATWNSLALGVAMQPVPPAFAKVVSIKCIDCERKESNRSWHFLGVQCNFCTSFNTAVERITLTGLEAATFLATIEE